MSEKKIGYALVAAAALYLLYKYLTKPARTTSSSTSTSASGLVGSGVVFGPNLPTADSSNVSTVGSTIPFGPDLPAGGLPPDSDGAGDSNNVGQTVDPSSLQSVADGG